MFYAMSMHNIDELFTRYCNDWPYWTDVQRGTRSHVTMCNDILSIMDDDEADDTSVSDIDPDDRYYMSMFTVDEAMFIVSTLSGASN